MSQLLVPQLPRQALQAATDNESRPFPAGGLSQPLAAPPPHLLAAHASGAAMEPKEESSTADYGNVSARPQLATQARRCAAQRRRCRAGAHGAQPTRHCAREAAEDF